MSESRGRSPRIAEPTTSAAAPAPAITTPRPSPWKCACAAIRNSAARRTPPSVSGAASSSARRSARSTAATAGWSAQSGSRRAMSSTAADHTTKTPSTAAARPSVGKPTNATASSATTATARRPVAAVHEALMELVGGGVAAGEREREQGRPARGHQRDERPPPEEAQERVLGEVDELAAHEVDHAEARVEARLVREEEDHAHQGERRKPQAGPEWTHLHTVESGGVLVITSKSPYAVRALSELARRGDAAPVPIGDLARARDIPPQFLEGLFATLRRAGILQSQRGVKGGYQFARPPAQVTVLEVVELLEGELAPEAAADAPVWQ